MFISNKMTPFRLLVQIVTLVGIVNCLLLIISQAAPTMPISSLTSPSSSAALIDHKSPASAGVAKFEATRQLPASSNSASPAASEQHEQHSLEPVSTSVSQKVKRDSKVQPSSAAELDTQETGHYLPSAYPSATESEYGYDAGKNNYGKQASDWSLYDQGQFHILIMMPLAFIRILPF